MNDTSKDAVERLADELPETNWGAPRLYRAADTFRALLAEREALTAEVARLKSERDELLRDNEKLLQIVRNVQSVREHEHKRAESALAEVARLTAALEFYGNAWGFKTNKRYGGLEWFPTEELLDDCGNTAKDALAAHAARRKGGV